MQDLRTINLVGIIVCRIRPIKVASTYINGVLSLAMLTLYISYIIPIVSSAITKSTDSLWTFPIRPGREIDQYLRHRTLSFHLHLTPLSASAAGNRNQSEILKLGIFLLPSAQFL